ncbi:uncharacterized protein [Drosophila kikkawai]|uniref:Peptidase aspartic putative domain-containing protein n=1 Tax=Drosophila kikkawai TaxID=30033 RepID=A0ABM4GFS7_DROKI
MSEGQEPIPQDASQKREAAQLAPSTDGSQRREPSPRNTGAGPASNLRSKAKTTLDVILLEFIETSDRLSKFESQIFTASSSEPNLFTLKIRLDQIQSLWGKVEREYETASRAALRDGGSGNLPLLQNKYEHCYAVFERCAAKLNEDIARKSVPTAPPTETFSRGCSLPPCDTEIFDGDYLRWPTFRDLFTAIYVNNSRLTPVEKLFHLNAKTSGEAHAIVAKSPLTNDGFQSAWSALQDRFENKRLLVNSQLKILFSLPTLGSESGTALKDLQSTIQGCLIALEHSQISTENWDCLLIFLISSKLPKVTLSLWEQSLTNKSAIPAWEEMNSFLDDRYRTLEAIEDVRPNSSSTQHSREPRSAQPRRMGTPAKPMLKIDTTAFVLPNLAGNLPTSTIDRNILDRLPNMPLADPSFFQPSQIDLLLGADILPSVLLSGWRPNVCGSLLAQETIFGWILTGPLSSTTSRVSSFTTQISIESEATMETLLTKFWEVEDLPCRLVKETDKLCEDFFVRTTTRSCDGKYIVSLPFKDSEHIDLGHSRSSALAQFLRNETRLKKEPALKDTYDSVIQEYIDLGHMKPVPPNTDKINFYLPHHAVFKPESATTKVRVVFNASSPSSNGNSLNDILYPGPVLQSDLTLQILKWRTFKFVFNADITKMYRQILLNQEHTPFQRILYRNGQGNISDFELQTVTFGVNCAPFLALRTLQQLSDDVNAQYPRASHIISNYMYVDDVLAGAHTEAGDILAIRELQAALDSAGFPLRRWTSNERALLKALPKEHLLSTDFLDLEEVSTTKTLGVRWNATTDEFYFVPTEVTIQANYSKRDVLSQIAKLFDPAEWLSPFVVQAKILMQDIWLASVEWDEFLPAELLHRWHDFLRSYSFLHQVRIPRWVHFQPGVQVQIHGFCDASQKAYGAAIYVRIQRDGIISSNLLTSKTKVAPVKTVSLPRLELCGAVLLADLWTAILPQIPFGRIESFLWTDSTIVLAWLNKPPCQWTTFVANRVTKIAQNTDASQWSHVRSEHNPADLASRGVAAEELATRELWWHGPSWLTQPQDSWPAPYESVSDIDIEKRPIRCHLACPEQDMLERFSKLDKALRVFAYVQRFIQRSQKRPIPGELQLSNTEISTAERLLIFITQRRYFALEYACLSQKRPIPASSSIKNMNPFLDPHGLIRAASSLNSKRHMRHSYLSELNEFGCEFH